LNTARCSTVNRCTKALMTHELARRRIVRHLDPPMQFRSIASN
jgi:hypothetical protein